jgi:hypothetical protein
MIYQHATRARDRDHAIAKALGTFVKEARAPRKSRPKNRNATSKAHDRITRVARM